MPLALAVPSEDKPHDGKRFRSWLDENVPEWRNCEPLAEEMCYTLDVMEGIRKRLESTALYGRERKQQLADYARFQKQFIQAWRVSGLARDDEQKRPVGRPPGSGSLFA
jgi:hypothetical protein